MIERTYDYRIVAKRHSNNPIISQDSIYLIDGDKGLWALHSYKDGLLSHVDMSVNFRGKEGIKLCKSAIKWAFDNTDTDVIYGVVNKENRACCRNAISTGYTFTHESKGQRHYEIRRGA